MIPLKLLHTRLLGRRLFYCYTKHAHIRWLDRFCVYSKNANVLVETAGNQLIYRTQSTGKSSDTIVAKPITTKADNLKDKIVTNVAVEQNNVQAKETSTTKTQKENDTKTQPTSNDGKIIVADSPTDHKASVKPATTKTFEVKTSKGILSVTTTIEDSKINDVILEKTTASNSAVVKALPVAKMSKAEVLKDTTAKSNETAEKSNKITQAASEGVKKVVEALIKPLPTTQRTESAAPSTPSTAAETTSEAHVLEIKPKKKTLNATVKAMEKLAAAGGAAPVTSQKIDIVPPAPTTPKPPRLRVDFNRSSLERNFITPARAMSDFLLKPSDLENLPKIKRRSPYEQEPPITVFWRRDVESKAIEIWGSRENLLNEQLKRDLERKKHQQSKKLMHF